MPNPASRAANSCGSGSTDRYFSTSSQTGVWISSEVCRCMRVLRILVRVATVESLISNSSTARSHNHYGNAAQDPGYRLRKPAPAVTRHFASEETIAAFCISLSMRFSVCHLAIDTLLLKRQALRLPQTAWSAPNMRNLTLTVCVAAH
jgi:hypothetical protein